MGALRSECEDQSAVPFVSMSVVGGWGGGQLTLLINR